MRLYAVLITLLTMVLCAGLPARAFAEEVTGDLESAEFPHIVGPLKQPISSYELYNSSISSGGIDKISPAADYKPGLDEITETLETLKVEEITFEGEAGIECDVETVVCKISIPLAQSEVYLATETIDVGAYEIEFANFSEEVSNALAQQAIIDNEVLLVEFSAENLKDVEAPEAATVALTVLTDAVKSQGMLISGKIYHSKPVSFTKDMITPQVSTSTRVVNLNDGGACAMNPLADGASVSMWPYFLTTLLGLIFAKRR